MPKNESNPMTASDAARIQSGQARGGGDMSSGGFTARAQRAAENNANANSGSANTNSASSGDFAARAQGAAANNANSNEVLAARASGTGQK